MIWILALVAIVWVLSSAAILTTSLPVQQSEAKAYVSAVLTTAVAPILVAAALIVTGWEVFWEWWENRKFKKFLKESS